MGVSLDVSRGSHSRIHSAVTASISPATRVESRGTETFLRHSSRSIRSVNCASPTSACCTGTHLLISVGSTVEWMIVLPSGIAIANGDSVKLQPIPKIRSALRRKCGTVLGWALPPEPSASR